MQFILDNLSPLLHYLGLFLLFILLIILIRKLLGFFDHKKKKRHKYE